MIDSKNKLVQITTKQIKQELFDYLCQNEMDHLRASLSKHYRAKEINLVFMTNSLSCFVSSYRKSTEYQLGVNNVIVYNVANVKNKQDINQKTVTTILKEFVSRLTNYDLIAINNQFAFYVTANNKQLHQHLNLWLLSNLPQLSSKEVMTVHGLDVNSQLVALYLCNFSNSDCQKITVAKMQLLFETNCLELTDSTLTATLVQKLTDRFFSRTSRLDFVDYNNYTLLRNYLQLLAKISFPIRNIILPIAQASDWLNYDLQSKQQVTFILDSENITSLKELPIGMPNESARLQLATISQLCAKHHTSFASSDFKPLVEKQLLNNNDQDYFNQIAELIKANLV